MSKIYHENEIRFLLLPPNVFELLKKQTEVAPKTITQIYLSRILRARKIVQEGESTWYEMTIKKKHRIERLGAFEMNFSIDEMDFAALVDAAEYTIEKVRYTFPTPEFKYELDYFPNLGITILEIEKPHDHEGMPPSGTAPYWIDRVVKAASDIRLLDMNSYSHHSMSTFDLSSYENESQVEKLISEVKQHASRVVLW